jgi:cation:H+ antiporter
VLITISASYIIKAVSDYAKKTGISDYIVGFLIVSIGTSLPEFVTAVTASFADAGNLVLGDLIGASILDVTLVLGLTAIVGRKIFVKGNVLDKTLFIILFIAILPLIVGFDGRITRIEGFILIAAYFFHLVLLAEKEGSVGEVKKDLRWEDIWQDMLIIPACIIAMLLSSSLFVKSAIAVANILEVPHFVVGLVLVAFCTTLPELIVELMSIKHGISGIAFGDILGSVVTNCTLILGVAAVIRDITFERTPFINSAFFMLTAVFISLLFIKKKEITWQEGLGLIMIYLTFLVSQGLANFI